MGTKYYDLDFEHTGTRQTTSLKLTVDQLIPGTLYSFVVIAETNCGEGDNSTEKSSQTKVDGMLLHYFSLLFSWYLLIQSGT